LNATLEQMISHDEWNRIGGPKYPHEKVVQYCFRKYPSKPRSKVRALDLGCGGGVHTVFLAREGFSVTGVDPSEPGLLHTREWLDREGLTATLEQMSLESLDYPSRSFDLVVCMEVLQCVNSATASEGLNRLQACLSENACGFFQFSSDEDSIHRHSPLSLRGYPREEVNELFGSGFKNVTFDRYITTYQNGAVLQNEWIVTFQGLSV
jgi:cyclopropane fatty-acyl-phospholipid synthase-like methyltransferase